MIRTGCPLSYEEDRGVKYVTCRLAATLISFNPYQRHDELERRGCPDNDCTCPYRSGRTVEESGTTRLHALRL